MTLTDCGAPQEVLALQKDLRREFIKTQSLQRAITEGRLRIRQGWCKENVKSPSIIQENFDTQLRPLQKL